MRTSILSRSMIAIASLAVGSVVLAGGSATAATPSGVTRDAVLSITNSIRTAEADDADYPDAVYEGVERLVALACGFTPSEGNGIEGLNFKLLTPGQVDGVVISAYLHEVTDPETGQYAHRQCSFGALVTTDASFALSGEATLAPVEVTEPVEQLRSAERVAPVAAPAPVQTKLSGDVFTTPALSIPDNGDFALGPVAFSATGNATRTTAVSTARKIWDKTSKAEKKAAKKKYAKRIAIAKKAYKKALRQAGGSPDKKAAAKRDYSAKRAKIVTRYKHEVWNYRYVKKAGTKTENRPFKVSARVQAISFG